MMCDDGSQDLSDSELLEAVDEDGENLTSWEVEFVVSLFVALRRYGSFTRTQRLKLDQIHEDRCP